MSTSLNSISKIKLPSFLRRVVNSNKLKVLIREEGCKLSRIGRSRNWQLQATFEQIEQVILLIDKSDEPSWQWLILHLGKQQKNLTFAMLICIANDKPGITVTELMSRTDCSIAEARRVIDTLEFE